MPTRPEQALRWFALALCASAAIVSRVSAQIVKSPPPEGATTHTVVPGVRYDAGGLRRWFVGGGYRDIWGVPIEIPVLDLDSEAGGLTVLETGGFGQSFTLEFLGADGLEYAVRSLDKDPTRRLDPLLVGTVVASIIQDQIGGFLPTAGLIVDPLLEAAGILYPRHKLVVVPDDPRLGEFREEYAGLIGMFVDRPQEGLNDTPGFAGSTRISRTDGFLEDLEEGACDRANAREYLKARFIDMVVGDRDRHAGQWRWARYPDGPECYVWRPIPVDRDQAFIFNDGFMLSIYRLLDYRQVKFGPSYPSLLGLTFNGWELDRQLLAEFDEPVWAAVAEELQGELTDAVIEAAVRRLPAPHYELRGDWLERSLKSRRDALLGEALDFYRLISNAAEIKGTDRDEIAVFEHQPDGDLTVTISYADGPLSGAPYFERTFQHEVTDEVRLFLQGGDDRVEVRGASGKIKVRAIGGGGDDEFVNASAAGGGLTRFYDARGENRFEGSAKVDEARFERPPAQNLAHRYALDWGHTRRYIPMISFSPDLGVQVGLLFDVDHFGFRKVPWHNRQSFTALLASAGPEPLLSWDGRFREALGPADLLIHAEYSGINILRFHGFGNDTQDEDDSNFFKLEQRALIFAPGIEWTIGLSGESREETVSQFRPTVKVGIGPVLKYSSTPMDDNADRFIGSLDPAPLGVGDFGQIGARTWFELDLRDNAAYPTSGIHLFASGSVFPSLVDVDDEFGEFHGTLSTYLTPGSSPRLPTLALRVGGKRVYGTFPFHEAAYLGGIDDLRGFREERFAGEAAAFGNAEIRLPVSSFNFLFPTEFGVLGAADVGRVFFDDDPDDADDWHSAFGGGVWFSLLDRRQTISISVLHGDDRTRLYAKAGLHF